MFILILQRHLIRFGVRHPKLSHKLQAYGFCGLLLCILSNILCDRTQQVVLPNDTSTLRSVISGVPQV